jgi:hypothetical protein
MKNIGCGCAASSVLILVIIMYVLDVQKLLEEQENIKLIMN